jgi:hypothetical protein
VSSTLLGWYDEIRAQGRGHKTAIHCLAFRLRVDEPTVERVLKRVRSEAQMLTVRTGGTP